MRNDTPYTPLTPPSPLPRIAFAVTRKHTPHTPLTPPVAVQRMQNNTPHTPLGLVQRQQNNTPHTPLTPPGSVQRQQNDTPHTPLTKETAEKVDPEGIAAISRWLSEAIPPERPPDNSNDPGGIAAALAGALTRRFALLALICDPSGIV